MAKLSITVCVHHAPDIETLALLDEIKRAQASTQRLLRKIGASLMASIEDFSAEVAELGTALTEQASDIDALAAFISEHGDEIPDSLLSELTAAVDKVSGNSARIVSLAQAAPEVPTDGGEPAGDDPSVPTEQV